MSIKNTINHLKKTINLSPATFAAAQSRSTLLSKYTNAGDATAAMAIASNLTAEERDALTLDVIREQQQTKHPLWQAMLIVAYEPMLKGFCAQPTREIEERESRYVAAFLEAVMRVRSDRPPLYIALHLKGMTAWLASRSASERLLDRALGGDVDELDSVAADSPADRAYVHEILDAVVELGGEEVLEALIAVHVEEESLVKYVERVHAMRSCEGRKRVYVRLLRQMQDVMALLRRRDARAERRTAA